MDLEFYNAMDILNEASSPPINVSSRVTNANENSLSNSGGGIMESNNRSLTPVATVEAVSNASADVVQSAVQTFPVSLPHLELKLPILSSSSSDSESEDPSNPTAGTSMGADGERVASPPPNCAICLGRCKNKCFTDSCMHQFCFKCLCEWSKVKPECPLCKQTFKSIIHNVKSIHQFEEYHVQPPTIQITHPPFDMDFPEMRIFGVVHQGHNRNQAWNDSTHRPLFFRGISAALAAANASSGGSTTSTVGAVLPTTASGSNSRSITLSGNGSGLRNQYVYRGELLDLYRQEHPNASSGTLSQLWRRYVYDRKLYAMPVADITGHFRESSARFYRDNPSQIHRLMPWINRDIVCLLRRQTQYDVTTVLESINSALTLMNITSPAFRRRIQPFFGTKTAHFIHELNNFARSPYDMIGYDRAVQYSVQTTNEDVVIEFTSSEESSDNEHIDVLSSTNDGGNGSGNNNARSTTNLSTSSNASINAINLTIHNRLTSATSRSGLSGVNADGGSENNQDDVSLVIDLRGESDNVDSSGNQESSSLARNLHDLFQPMEDDNDMLIMPSVIMPAVADNIELTSGSSDECEFVLERKPPHLRTPEMVSLDSASDSDVVFVEEMKPTNKTSFSSSEGEQPKEAESIEKSPVATAAATTTTTRSKITALLEAKKRNNESSGNLVKNENDQTEIYNVGASTSAALRLSLQKRGDKSNKTESNGRLRRKKCALRNTERNNRLERGGGNPTKSRGKRLDSESSHSSTSTSSTSSTTTSRTSSTSSTTITTTSSSTSDEEYVAHVTQRQKKVSSNGGCCGSGAGVAKENQLNRRKHKKTKKGPKTGNSTTNRDSKKRKKSNKDHNSSGDDDDEEDNGHMGKNFALVMAISERMKRQNQKRTSEAKRQKKPLKAADESEDENSWRINAINEPLRKQQQQQLENSQKTHNRKRHRKTTTRSNKATDNNRADQIEKKRRKINDKTENDATQQQQHKNNSTSSDESDNINLIQLKTKLISENNNLRQILAQMMNEDKHEANTSSSIKEKDITTAPSSTLLDQAPETTTRITQSSATNASVSPTPNSPPDIKYNINNDPSNSTDSSDTHDNGNDDDNEQKYGNTNAIQMLADAAGEYQQQQQQKQEQEEQHYQQNNYHHEDNNNDNDDDNDDSSRNIIAATINLPESNVFVDGTSMSNTTTTTTTDTILHDAAEQISLAAVNFYNPQQTFNTVDFAADDDNSTNSSSSDSSLNSSLSSSSNSSTTTTNTDTFVNYEHP